ncbi:hypothetical protein Fmac_022928 [Flemingia macrophylla]|uniref:S-protein homolog n=1 Tax=Flemingia macrophylla TaxID=520843 RepID=A0ABD1LLP6_9FABA
MKNRVLVMVLFTVCLMNVLSFADPSVNGSATSNSNNIDINILALSFYDGMAPNNKYVNLFYNNQKEGVYLQPGQSYVKLDNLNGPKSAVMYWNGNCASFFAYDPRADGSHQKIFWLMKEDGVYRSYDNKSWQKIKSWTFNHC